MNKAKWLLVYIRHTVYLHRLVYFTEKTKMLTIFENLRIVVLLKTFDVTSAMLPANIKYDYAHTHTRAHTHTHKHTQSRSIHACRNVIYYMLLA